MLLIYFLCFLFFILDTYLFQGLFSEYKDIEPEYRPVEQATRLAYLLVAAIAWKDIQKTRLYKICPLAFRMATIGRV